MQITMSPTLSPLGRVVEAVHELGRGVTGQEVRRYLQKYNNRSGHRAENTEAVITRLKEAVTEGLVTVRGRRYFPVRLARMAGQRRRRSRRRALKGCDCDKKNARSKGKALAKNKRSRSKKYVQDAPKRTKRIGRQHTHDQQQDQRAEDNQTTMTNLEQNQAHAEQWTVEENSSASPSGV